MNRSHNERSKSMSFISISLHGLWYERKERLSILINYRLKHESKRFLVKHATNALLNCSTWFRTSGWTGPQGGPVLISRIYFIFLHELSNA